MLEPDYEGSVILRYVGNRLSKWHSAASQKTRIFCNPDVTTKQFTKFYILLTVRLVMIHGKWPTLTHNSFLCIYFNSLRVSSNLVLIIRRIDCIITTSGICHSVSVIVSYVFISVFEHVWATSCSSSGESIVSLQPLVYVTVSVIILWVGRRPAHEMITNTEWHNFFYLDGG